MPGKKILIVDDDDDVISIVASLLEYKGYRVVAVRDGDLAIHQVCENMPDLIILDVMMPHMNGFNVCRTLKVGNSTGGIPIIILTARHTGSEARDALEAKADCYIQKPFDNKVLLDKIEELLRRGR
ncbi:MAG: response regulator [Endomicrobiales bacterium]|nr:response regulator [Endomicrobiales bacterium]